MKLFTGRDMLRQILVDTSFFYAHAYADDPHHREAVKFLENPPVPLVTTNFIFDELMTILRYNFGHRVAVTYGQSLRKSKLVNILRITPEDEESAWEIFSRYSDQKFSFTDCTSFAFMRRLGITEAAAFDIHFEVAGFLRLPPASLASRGQ
jgi:hypothetical protein